MASATIISVLILYLAVLLAIGAWGAKDSKSLTGYYLADKRLPAWIIAFSANSTGESAWLLLGLTGMGYVVGVHALWVVLGEVLGVALAWSFVALPFKRYTDRYGSITVTDYLTSRFRDSGHTFRLIGVVIIVSMVTTYMAAQLTASGKAFDAFLGTGYTGGVLLGAAVIFYYTTVGGFKAVAYSDGLQGLLMLSGLIVLPVIGVAAAGGWSAMVTALRVADPILLEPMGTLGLSIGGVVSAVSFAGIGMAFLGAPQLLTRFMAARSENEIVSGSLIAVVCIIVFDLGAVLTGMAGRVLVPGLSDPEMVLPILSADLFPALFTGLFLVVVLAAIMSTADSVLLLASSAVVRDVVQPVFRPDLDQRRLALYGKLTTVVIGLVGLGFALTETRLIFWFVLFAWSGLASAFTPVVVCSLFWSGTTRAGAIAGMVSGFLAAVIWVLVFKSSFYELYEMWPGFLTGFGVTIGVSLMTAPPEGAAEEHQDVWSFHG